MNLEMRKDPMRIKDVITMSNGFFAHIPYTFPDDITKESLDFQFFTSYGLKNVAPVVTLMQDDNVSQLTNQALDTIGQAIWQTYHHKWDRQVAVYDIEYNPIYNYKDEYHETHSDEGTDSKDDRWSDTSMQTRTDNLSEEKTAGTSSTATRTDNLIEQLSKNTTVDKTRTDNLSDQRTDNLSEQHSGNVTENSTRTDNLTQLETRNLTESQNDSGANNVFGYNSETSVGDSTDTDTSSKSDTGTVTTSNTGTQGTQGTTTDGRQIASTGTVTHLNTGTQTELIETGGSDTTAHTGTQTNQTVNSGKDTILNTGTQTTSGSGSGTKGSEGAFENSGQKDYTHIGNIGNHPTQQLIGDEIELWRWNFVQEVLNDVKEFTTISVYLC